MSIFFYLSSFIQLAWSVTCKRWNMNYDCLMSKNFFIENNRATSVMISKDCVHYEYTRQVSRLRRDCHACESKTWISRLLTPVLQFVTPGGKVWAIMLLTDTFWKIYLSYLKKPEPEKRRVYVDERLSPNSLFLVGKSMFLWVPMFMLDRTLRNVFRTSSDIFRYYRILRKILALLR